MIQKKYFAFIILCFLYIGCEHATDPIDTPRKDPRTYTWTIDTIYNPNLFQVMMRTVWGSSPNDIYVTGYTSGNPGQMYHFDGTKWKEVALYTSFGGSIDIYVDMEKMIGFSKNDIWAAGYGGFSSANHLIHYDGNRWTTVPMPYKDIGLRLMAIGGTSSNDIWLGGQNTYNVFHYNGAVWRKDSLPVIFPSKLGNGNVFDMKSIVADKSGNVFAVGFFHCQDDPLNPRETQYFFSWKDSKWSLVDSNIFTTGQIAEKWGQYALWVSPSNTLYSAGGGTFVMKNGNWQQYSYLPNGYLHSITGTSDDNIFAVGDYGSIGHYNGTDWYALPAFNDPQYHYRDVWTDGNEVFIVGIIGGYPTKTVVVHGK